MDYITGFLKQTKQTHDDARIIAKTTTSQTRHRCSCMMSSSYANYFIPKGSKSQLHYSILVTVFIASTLPRISALTMSSTSPNPQVSDCPDTSEIVFTVEGSAVNLNFVVDIEATELVNYGITSPGGDTVVGVVYLNGSMTGEPSFINVTSTGNVTAGDLSFTIEGVTVDVTGVYKQFSIIGSTYQVEKCISLYIAVPDCPDISNTVFTMEGSAVYLNFMVDIETAVLVSYGIASPGGETIVGVVYSDGSMIGKPSFINVTSTGNLTAGDLSFTIEAVTLDVIGQYKQFSVKDSTYQVEKCTTLYIVGMPSKPTISTDKDVAIGDNVTLTCSSVSTTKPKGHGLNMTYNWYGNALTNTQKYSYSGQHKQQLVIFNITGSEGWFMCEATEDVPNAITSPLSDILHITIEDKTSYASTLPESSSSTKNPITSSPSMIETATAIISPSTTTAPPDCGELEHVENGNVSLATATNTSYKAIATYQCNEGYHIIGFVRRKCMANGQWSGTAPNCSKANTETFYPHCPNNTDSRNTVWQETRPGTIQIKECQDIFHNEQYEGIIYRNCSRFGEWLPTKYECIRKKLQDLQNDINDALQNPSEATVGNALDELTVITVTNTDESDDTADMTDGEIEVVTSVLEDIASLSRNVTVSREQYKAFMNITSNLLDRSNQNAWRSIEYNSYDGGRGADKVLAVIDTYTDVIAQSLKANESKEVVIQPNIALVVARLDETSDLIFPDDSLSLSINSPSNFRLPQKALEGSNAEMYSAVFYRNLTGLLSSRTANSEPGENSEINSAVLSLKLSMGVGENLAAPLSLVFEHFQDEYINPQCSFWNYTRNSWDTAGCRVMSTNTSITICECDHLTNFAILMSPWIQNNVDTTVLDVVSIVGCSISLLGLVVTVAVHIFLWRYLKSDRVVLLINLSLALALSYVIFLAGVDRTENKDLCTAVAVLLQYIYLVVFSLMLVEGIEIAVTLLYVFATKSRLKWLIPCAWGIPAVIVGISLGATKLDGYGTNDFCWLSVEDGLIWSFVGPAMLIILVNSVLLVLIMKTMYGTKTFQQKTKMEKTKSGVRSLFVLLPLMGCTWVLGVFYVNEDMAWIQYVFAVCNGLQGFVIFVFYCAFNRQVRAALVRRNKKYSMSNTWLSSATNSNDKTSRIPKTSSTTLS